MGTTCCGALHESPEDREIATEVELCQVLSRYFAQIGETGQVVFDGGRPGGQERVQHD